MASIRLTQSSLKFITCTTLGLIAISSLTSCSSTTENIKPTVEATKPTQSSTTSSNESESTANSSVITADPSSAKIECESIAPSESLYNLNPNLALLPDVHLDQTLESRQIHELGGTGCQLTNLSTNSNIEIEIVKLTNTSSKELEQKLQENGSLSTVQLPENTTGYFSQTDSVGQTQFIQNNYWVSISSEEFTSAIETTTIASLVISGI